MSTCRSVVKLFPGLLALAVLTTAGWSAARGVTKVKMTDSSLSLRSLQPHSADTAWVRSYNGPGNSADRANAMQVDAAGSVYVTGQSHSLQGIDCVTLKYDTDGNLLWERHYRGPLDDTMNVPVKLVLDGAGNVYVAGWSLLPTYDYFTLKYDNGGTLKWHRRYNGPADGSDVLAGLAVDRAGNAYVTGYSAGVGTGTDFATLKYDSAGTLIWERRYDGPLSKDDAASAIEVDSSFNVFVGGGAATDSIDSGEFGYISTRDFATLKYDLNGTLLWTRLYSGAGHTNDAASAMQVDVMGNVCITGISDGGLGHFFDYATLKYDPDGNLLWERRYDGPSHLYDEPFALQTDAASECLAHPGVDLGGRDMSVAQVPLD